MPAAGALFLLCLPTRNLLPLLPKLSKLCYPPLSSRKPCLTSSQNALAIPCLCQWLYLLFPISGLCDFFLQSDCYFPGGSTVSPRLPNKPVTCLQVRFGFESWANYFSSLRHHNNLRMRLVVFFLDSFIITSLFFFWLYRWYILIVKNPNTTQYYKTCKVHMNSTFLT